jgi:hypothetical protein
MDQQSVSEIVARQLARVWEIHRTPAFVDYLLQTFGCEPLRPVQFAGIFSMQMIGGYLFPDLPAGPGPVVEGLWLMDDAGLRPSNMGELRSVADRESDNPLVVFDPSSASYKPIGFQPRLFVYPRIKFCVRKDRIVYCEVFGCFATCTKSGKLVVADQVSIQDVYATATTWQGRYKDLQCDVRNSGIV